MQTDTYERWFVARTLHFTPTPQALTEDEQSYITGFRWWTAEELVSTTERVFPPDLGARLTELTDAGHAVLGVRGHGTAESLSRRSATFSYGSGMEIIVTLDCVDTEAQAEFWLDALAPLRYRRAFDASASDAVRHRPLPSSRRR
jgi:hypothetical protein